MLALNGLLAGIDAHMTKKQLLAISPMANVAYKGLAGASFGLLGVLAMGEKPSELLEGLTLMACLFLGCVIVNSFLIRVLHNKILRTLGSIQTTMFTTLTPVFSVVFAMAIFRAWFTGTQWLGVGLIVFVLWQVRAMKKHVLEGEKILPFSDPKPLPR